MEGNDVVTKGDGKNTGRRISRAFPREFGVLYGLAPPYAASVMLAKELGRMKEAQELSSKYSRTGISDGAISSTSSSSLVSPGRSVVAPRWRVKGEKGKCNVIICTFENHESGVADENRVTVPGYRPLT